MAPELRTVTSNPNVSHWSLENGYDKGIFENTYPIRVFNAKQGAALSVVLQLFIKDIEFICAGPITGFKLMLTAPDETRKASARYFQIVTSEKTEILIRPKMITTSEKLRRYKPEQRQCFFDSERQLRFYKIYTQNNCEAECLSNFTKMERGCVKFSMPSTNPAKNFVPTFSNRFAHFAGDKSTGICGSFSARCYRNAENRLFGAEAINDQIKDTVRVFREQCNCLAACNSIKYEADIDRIKFDYEEILKSLGLASAEQST